MDFTMGFPHLLGKPLGYSIRSHEKSGKSTMNLDHLWSFFKKEPLVFHIFVVVSVSSWGYPIYHHSSMEWDGIVHEFWTTSYGGTTIYLGKL